MKYKSKTTFIPLKKLGQNFLTDKNILNKIFLLGKLNNEDEVIEIGPGKGALTKYIADTAKSVIAIEKDSRLIDFLQRKFSNHNNIEFLNSNILDIKFEDYYSSRKLKLLSNLPYNISVPILTKILKSRNIFSRIVVTIQKEVGDKICSDKNSKSYGSLSVILQNYFDIKMGFKIPPSAFYPKPKVDSVVLTLIPRDEPRFYVKDEKLFEIITRQSFSNRRKIIKNALNNNFDKDLVDESLKNSGIDYRRRAESISILEFTELTNSFYDLYQLTSSSSNLV